MIARIITLFGSGSRDENPPGWQVMRHDLEITRKDEKRVNIWLYKTFEGPGAYAIGPTRERRTYYRGASDEEIKKLIQDVISRNEKKPN